MTKYPFPKVELHLHLDGSVLPETAWELAQAQGVTLPADSLEEFRKFIVVTADCRSVNEYLKRFEIPLQILQDTASLQRVTKELICLLESQGVAYAEIRFAPQLHTRKELSQEDAIRAVLAGREEALRMCKEIKIGIILCTMCVGEETLNEKENLETVELAKKYLGQGVVAIDLAGAEGIVPLTHFSPVFQKAKELGVPFTCHAGDSQESDTVEDAMNFGSRRIGHGHHIYEDESLCCRAIQDKVTLEICPTSNIQCQTRFDYDKHPAKMLFDMGLRVTINTDNMVLSNIDLDHEYDCCIEKMGFTEKDLIQMNLYAAEAAFLPEDEKKELIERIRGYLQ